MKQKRCRNPRNAKERRDDGRIMNDESQVVPTDLLVRDAGVFPATEGRYVNLN